MSQESAADALGISRSALKQIETGLLPLSEEIRARILLLTGAKLPLGVCRKSIAPVAWDDTPYSEKSYRDWRHKLFTEDGPSPAEENFKRALARDLDGLLDMARQRWCFFPFGWALQTTMGELARNFGLTGEGLLEEEAGQRLFGNLLERAIASGIDLELPPKPKKSAGSKKKRREPQ
jgi:transcriptional regulator with XRE-family HTH domain